MLIKGRVLKTFQMPLLSIQVESLEMEAQTENHTDNKEANLIPVITLANPNRDLINLSRRSLIR